MNVRVTHRDFPGCTLTFPGVAMIVEDPKTGTVRLYDAVRGFIEQIERHEGQQSIITFDNDGAAT